MLPLAFVLAISSFYAFLIAMENRRIFMVILLLWIAPSLLATFLGAAFSSYQLAIYLSAVSPGMLILFGAGFLLPPDVNAETTQGYTNTATIAFWIGVAVQLAFIALMMIKWESSFRKLKSIAQSGTTDVPKSLLEGTDD